MARADLITMMKYRKMDTDEFNFNMLSAPPINYFLTPTDIGDLRSIAMSIKYSSKAKLKKQMQNEIMERRGFKFFHAGTNRNVYRFLDDNTFLFKVMHSRSGINDNLLELKNQWYIAPACTKIFDVTQCGTVGSVERVEPITSREEFISLAPDIFDLISKKLIGKFVIADIGTRYFRNFGLRLGYGPVIVDFPYVYNLDGKKLYCSHTDPNTNGPCGGAIDYDFGFNELHCNKCGLEYKADELMEKEKIGLVVKEGGRFDVKVVGMRGDMVVVSQEKATTTIHRPRIEEKRKTLGNVVVKAGYGDDTIVYESESKPMVTKPKAKFFTTAPEVKVTRERSSEKSDKGEIRSSKPIKKEDKMKMIYGSMEKKNESIKPKLNDISTKVQKEDTVEKQSEKDISIVLAYLDNTPADEVDWEFISSSMYMSQKFMQTHKDELVWELLPKNPNITLTDSFIDKYRSRIYPNNEEAETVYKDTEDYNLNTDMADMIKQLQNEHPNVGIDNGPVMGAPAPTRIKRNS